MKRVLITGASSGIGRSISKKLIDSGHLVIGLARRKEKLDALRNELGKNFVPHQVDVVDTRAIQEMGDRVREEHGKIDVLINNAGVGHLGAITEGKLEEWHNMFDVNVKGLLSLTHIFLPDLRDQKGQIINIDSVAGHEVYPTAVVYCASKWAVKAISMGLEKELRGEVKITNISPGAVETEFVNHTSVEEKRKEMQERFQDVLTGEDIAEAVLFSMNQRNRAAINEITIRPWK